MELRQRLTLLRSQSGAPPCPAAPPPPAGPVSVAERMQRLRGVPHPDSHSSRDVQTAALLGGEVLAAGLIVVEQRFALTHQHGQRYLTSITGLQQPLPLLDQALPAEHMVFLDTETTGLAGGTGTVAFLLGVGRIAGDTLSVRQFFLTGFRGEAAMLQAVATWVSDSSYLVTFNGKSFDLPLLTTRYRLARLADPFRDIQHIDLFHPTRRAFQRQWPDCRLQTAEQRLLGFRRQHDLPAHLVPEAWFAFVRRGTTTKLPALLEHNRWDLVSLVALLPTLTEAFHRPAEHGADVTAIARYWRMRGDEQRALTYLQAHEWHLDVTGLLDLAALYKRQRCWSAAVAIWHRLEAQRSVAALEELAKYYEHVGRDPAAALVCTRQLQRLEPRNAAHPRRLQRLVGKMSAGGMRMGESLP